jgi:predicted phage tail protein
VTAALDSPVLPDTPYFYRLRATNASGASAFSNLTSAKTPLQGQPPLAPAGLSAAASASLVTLTWSHPGTDETGFELERSTQSTTGFSLIVTPSAGASTAEDRAVVGGTTYFYRLRAINAAGTSGWSNVASALVPVQIVPPSAPSGLTASPVGAVVQLAWTDTSNNETGFHVEHSTQQTTGFTELLSPAANAVGANVTGLSPGTHWFRVRAHNSAGFSAYSNTAQATLAAATFTLNVAKAGLGASGGTVTSTPSGIGCGADCNQAWPAGKEVVLTAAVDSVTAFGGWNNCTTSSGSTCNVTLTQNTTVTATFGLRVANILVSAPASSQTGNYTVSWTCTSGLCSTSFTLQEDDTTAFSSPTSYSYSAGTPATYSFTNKANGV